MTSIPIRPELIEVIYETFSQMTLKMAPMGTTLKVFEQNIGGDLVHFLRQRVNEIGGKQHCTVQANCFQALARELLELTDSESLEESESFETAAEDLYGKASRQPLTVNNHLYVSLADYQAARSECQSSDEQFCMDRAYFDHWRPSDVFKRLDEVNTDNPVTEEMVNKYKELLANSDDNPAFANSKCGATDTPIPMMRLRSSCAVNALRAGATLKEVAELQRVSVGQLQSRLFGMCEQSGINFAELIGA